MIVETQIIYKLQSAGRCACAMGEYENAESIHRRALYLIQERYGAYSLEYTHCLEDIAEIYELKEDWVRAEGLYTEAMTALRTGAHTEQAQIALVLRNLAEVCRQQGKTTDAKQFELEAANILSKRSRASQKDK